MKFFKIMKQLLLWIIPKRLNLFRHKFLVYFSQKNLAVVLPQDSQFPVFLRLDSTDFRCYKQIFLEKIYHISLPFEPRFIIDCGGNIGLTSVFFAMMYPNSKIICIEPEIANYHILQKNLATYQNICSLNMGVWNKTTKLVIKNDENKTANNQFFYLEEYTPDIDPATTNLESDTNMLKVGDNRGGIGRLLNLLELEKL
jgi:FkbM family methyltransferase